ncbi:MAG TPA: dTDP-4-dehydrorhamnose 3,5-epimerase family protein, partial [Deinococcales bacterium]|nr:dTDP-4-dehydrorhamnose 3,5-epimerase family protein [Deinococcales bacterium]
ELMRFNGGQIEDLPTTMEPRQVSISLADPHRINAFHIHPRRGQNEIWTVVAGKMTVWLIDCRRASPTAGNKRRYLLSGEEPAHLHIPAGVAHGYKAGPTGATLIYVMDQQFDAGDPDEGRLPAGLFDGESPIAW